MVVVVVVLGRLAFPSLGLAASCGTRRAHARRAAALRTATNPAARRLFAGCPLGEFLFA
jgi:hypothetical protein